MYNIKKKKKPEPSMTTYNNYDNFSERFSDIKTEAGDEEPEISGIDALLKYGNGKEYKTAEIFCCLLSRHFPSTTFTILLKSGYYIIKSMPYGIINFSKLNKSINNNVHSSTFNIISGEVDFFNKVSHIQFRMKLESNKSGVSINKDIFKKPNDKEIKPTIQNIELLKKLKCSRETVKIIVIAMKGVYRSLMSEKWLKTLDKNFLCSLKQENDTIVGMINNCPGLSNNLFKIDKFIKGLEIKGKNKRLLYGSKIDLLIDLINKSIKIVFDIDHTIIRTIAKKRDRTEFETDDKDDKHKKEVEENEPDKKKQKTTHNKKKIKKKLLT
jgi:hypothetical protein